MLWIYTVKFKNIICTLIIILLAQITFAQNSQQEINMYKRTIMIDLDGVLDNYSKYDESTIPEIKTGAKEFVEKLYLSGKYDLVLFTTRSPKMALEWLIKNKMDMYFKDVTNVKTPAYIYLDDRAIQFKGDYETAFEEIENFKVYWKP